MKKKIIAGVCALMICAGFVVFAPPTRLDPSLKDRAESSFARYFPSAKRPGYIILIDYDLPVYKNRLWVIDSKTGAIMIKSHVSHALKSGLVYADDFSNTPDSQKSCTGVFATGEKYSGFFGYSMRIDGLEKGVNDKARERAIVFHPHLSPWSKGCFMTFPWTNRELIDLTSNNAMVFVNKTCRN